MFAHRLLGEKFEKDLEQINLATVMLREYASALVVPCTLYGRIYPPEYSPVNLQVLVLLKNEPWLYAVMQS